MKAIKFLSVFGVASILSSNLQAQQGEVELDPITVTASLHPVSSS
ncbi:MAG: hypothetical protein JWQ09_5166, partial [Segetibacter sp.]|nr:hypothetical protein [Segetibacter sp.]